MNKSAFIIAVIFAAGISIAAHAQSNQVDPGVSTHNYKHPNKAAKARAQRTDEIVVSNINTIETYSKQQNSRYVSTTPKYAPRATPLVFERTYQKEGVDINPLVSPRNYKTPNKSAAKSNLEVADYFNPADTTNLPTID